jgi:hypothetical protein
LVETLVCIVRRSYRRSALVSKFVEPSSGTVVPLSAWWKAYADYQILEA